MFALSNNNALKRHGNRSMNVASHTFLFSFCFSILTAELLQSGHTVLCVTLSNRLNFENQMEF